MDIQAAKNVALTELAYLVCYIPFKLFTRFGHLKPNASRAGWPGFLAQFCIFSLVASNLSSIVSEPDDFARPLTNSLKIHVEEVPFKNLRKSRRPNRIWQIG